MSLPSIKETDDLTNSNFSSDDKTLIALFECIRIIRKNSKSNIFKEVILILKLTDNLGFAKPLFLLYIIIKLNKR